MNTSFSFQAPFFVDEFVNPVVSNLSTTTTKHILAYRIGAGVEQMVTNNIGLTLDYIYTAYGRAKNSGVANTISLTEDGSPFSATNIDGLHANSSGYYATQEVMVGIKYYFYDFG